MVLEFITEPIFAVLDVIFLPIVNAWGPMLGVFVISTIVAFFITLANKLLVDQERLQHVQTEMKGFQQEMMAAQKSGDPKAMAEVQKKQSEFMKLQQEMMMNSFKPMIVTMVPILLIFWWMAAQPAINKLVVELPSFVYYVLFVWLFHMFYHQSPGVPIMAIEWLGWYILCSFAMSMIFRKFMGLKSGGI
ncbi:DUF106 domain-containing protein [Methanobacterium ferruginis]|uniref:DUF106 domain-containing protein n=1 Tax=Methanobacterium ferruginis TaxID=710191 RepID=UPI0025731E7E|nr:EMC3/TMCO1 family protein [Methanobacterium ferruginis]BDZ69055.1 membrane protein [Methanobacterium ferruginis]